MIHFRRICLLLVVVMLLGGLGAAPPTQAKQPSVPAQAPAEPAVVRLYVKDRAELDQVAWALDIWEVHYDKGYAVVAVDPEQYQWLSSLGYRLEIDADKTALLGIETPLDSRFYYFDDNYVNPLGRYIVDWLQEWNAAYPDLVELIDVGDAWQALHGGYHRDMWVLRITNEDPAYGAIADKPPFFLFANIHAREVATPELAIRYIKYLTSGWDGGGGYNVDPDTTWLVNHNVVYVLVSQNPDGRVVNEADTSAYRRKNMNNNLCPTGEFGIDLNRNHSFLWGCCGGSSGDACSETYRGAAKNSEPETQAFQSYFASVIPDQNGPNDDVTIAPASPVTTTGIFISLHSYADEVLWPWELPGYPGAPNTAQLQTIGRKFAYYNGMTPSGNIGYTVDGSSDNWTYGKFGIAAYTFEVGSGGSCGDFFPEYGCIDGIDGMPRSFWDENGPAFLYAHKIARTPYLTAYGPDSEDVVAMPGGAEPGQPVQLTATVTDHRYGGDPLQPISGAEYFVDAPGQDGAGTAMAAADGAWGGLSEGAVATVDTTGLAAGRHYILVHGLNDDGIWGPFTAVFLYVLEPGVSPVLEGYVREASSNVPLEATVTAGAFVDTTDPATGYYSMTIISGTYEVSAIAAGHVVSTVTGIMAGNYQTVQQDFYLHPICDAFADDVESGNLGWTAQTPWAITTESSQSATHSWTDSPGGSYSNNRNISLTSPVFDLSGYTGVTLSFWHIYDTEAGWDTCNVEYSTDGGQSWSLPVASYNGPGHTTWTKQELSVPELDGVAGARIRFRFYSDGSQVYDGWHVDDIALSGGGPACQPPLAPGAEFSSNSPVTLGEQMIFTNQTTGTAPFSFWWDFGDGLETSIEVNPSYTYLSAGTFTVTLTATNSVGVDSTSHLVVVEPRRLYFYLPIVVKNP